MIDNYDNYNHLIVMAAIWILLLCVVGFSDELQEDVEDEVTAPIILEDKGIALTPNSYIVSGTSKVYMSVFLKIKHPLIDSEAGKMLCVKADSCEVPSKDIYDKYLAVGSKCRYEGHNEKISLIESYTDIYLHKNKGSQKSCMALCLTNKDCKGIQWSNGPVQVCRLRRDRPVSDPLALIQGENKYEIDMVCLEQDVSRAQMCGSTTKPLYRILELARREARTNVWKINQQRFHDLKSAYNIDISSESHNGSVTSHKKRFATAALLGIPVVLGLVGGLFGAYNSYEVKKLNNHLEAFESRFDQFANQVQDLSEKQRIFNRDVLYLVKDLQEHTDERLIQLECDIAALTLYDLESYVFQTWKDKINTIFKSVQEGMVTQALNPSILSASDIKYLVNSTKILSGTIYEDNPALLLRSADMSLITAYEKEDHYVFHFVLSTMHVPNTNIFQHYDASTIPILIDDQDMCLQFKLPNRIFRKGDEFYSAEFSECSVRPSGLVVCLDDFNKGLNQNSLKIDCLNEGKNCISEEVHCTTVVKQIRSGALIFSYRDSVYGIGVNDSLSLIKASVEGKPTRLYSWSDYSQLQLSSGRILYALGNEDKTNAISWKSHGNTTLWKLFLDSRVKLHQESNFSRINQMLQEQNEKIEFTLTNQHISNRPILISEICAYTAMSLWILVIVVGLFVYGYISVRRVGNQRKTIKELQVEMMELRAVHQRNDSWSMWPTNRSTTSNAALIAVDPLPVVQVACVKQPPVATVPAKISNIKPSGKSAASTNFQIIAKSVMKN